VSISSILSKHLHAMRVRVKRESIKIFTLITSALTQLPWPTYI